MNLSPAFRHWFIALYIFIYSTTVFACRKPQWSPTKPLFISFRRKMSQFIQFESYVFLLLIDFILLQFPVFFYIFFHRILFQENSILIPNKVCTMQFLSINHTHGEGIRYNRSPLLRQVTCKCFMTSWLKIVYKQ